MRMPRKKLFLTLGVLVLLALGGLVWWRNGGTGIPTRVFEADAVLEGNFSVPVDTKVVVKNGATLTVNGDLLVQGILECDGGPLNLNVKGTFSVEKTLQCSRTAALPAGDLGFGISVVAGDFDITKDAVVVSNGHVQFVHDAAKLAKTREALDALYVEAGTYRTERHHLGPLTPLDEIPDTAVGKPVSVIEPGSSATVGWAGTVARALARPAFAHEDPALDAAGNPVANTVKVGGTWYVGNPGQAPPPNLNVPTPPKGVDKIIVNFDFGDDGVNLADFELTGPDGRAGTDADGSCTVTGGKGEDAMRLLVRADNITINNFDLHLGSGGPGGTATTSKDCDPGVATGGEGGLAGNFKMVASESFSIAGAFNLFPGKGGPGGTATAYGKKGDDGCAGLKGGDATATGGKGGDNTKLLTASGSISGKENISIREMWGGRGGDGGANSGAGGNGTGPSCAGGPGGKATAAGGAGGNTTCAKFPCTGGAGGDPSANPGTGGTGGLGSATEPGGNGGTGGDASATAGKGGKGTTANGNDGTVKAETGGNGGDGGDGCGPGAGGAGGAGKPEGEIGKDGKNLCVVNQNVNFQTTPTNENANLNTNSATTPTPEVSISADTLTFTHDIGTTACPTPIGTVRYTAKNLPEGASVDVDASTVPPWLTYTLGNALSAGTDFTFTCTLERYESQALTANVKIRVLDANDQVIKEFTVTVFGTITK
jgi:hypothetical protein